MKIRKRKYIMKMVKENFYFRNKNFPHIPPYITSTFLPLLPYPSFQPLWCLCWCVCVLVFMEIYMGENFSFTVRRRKLRIGNLHSGKSSNLLNYIEKCLKFPFKGATSLQIVDISTFI